MTRLRTPAGALLLVVLAVAIGACSGNQAGPPVPSSRGSATPSPSSASATATARATIQAGASPSDGPPATPRPTSSPSPSTSPQMPGVPPPAAIGRVGGSLGSYTWDGVLADGPWIVPKSGVHAAPATRLTIAFGGGAGTTLVSWDASWAPVRNGTAGTPRAAGSGQGAVSLVTPGGAGTWSLRLTAHFGEAQEATWFWRVTVGP